MNIDRILLTEEELGGLDFEEDVDDLEPDIEDKEVPVSSYIAPEQDEYDDVDQEEYPGRAAIINMKADPQSVPVAHDKGVNYIDAKDLDNYSKASKINNPMEIIDNVAKANNITTESIVLVGVTNEEAISELQSYGILLEKSSYSDAATLSQTMSWYKKFVKQCQKGIMDKKDLDERINILEECMRAMKKEYIAVKNRDESTRDRQMYAWKAFIPFNSLIRFIRNRDDVAGFGGLMEGLLFFTGMGTLTHINIRWYKYADMLEKQMEYTQESIDFLKSKRDDFQ